MLSSLSRSSRSAAPGFSRRADPALLPEWMDEPCSYEQFRDCLNDLARVNAISFGYRPTLQWLSQLSRMTRMHRMQSSVRWDTKPVHIVDVGCGRGDMLYQVARWARRHGLRVRLTGVDLNPYAARAAVESYTHAWPNAEPNLRSAASPEAGPSSGPNSVQITWVTGDAFSYTPPGGIDVIISSLFTHHLPDEEIVRFLAWMEKHARYGWFINDLHRSATSARVFGWLAGLAGWHAFVRHDGPVSFQRSFSVDDWQRYGRTAGLDMEKVTIEGFRPGRLCVGRIK